MYGGYSEKYAQKYGYWVYENSDGKEVKVTFVCRDLSEWKSCTADDKKFVGIVVKMLRSVMRADKQVEEKQ